MATVKEIGEKLVALCREGRNKEALETLSSPNVVSVEAQGSPQMPAVMEGMAAVRGKGEWWESNHEIHRAEAKGPFPNGDRFAVIFNYEVTPKIGPMAGRRIEMEEVALYTVKDGKIVREEFFYSMG
jgi:ketosteroid isomerase-like protein